MLRKVLPFFLFGVMAAVGIVGYSALREPEAPSGPLQAAPLRTEVAGVTSASAEQTVFTIDQTQSEARFVVDEVLRGEPRTVVGETNQIAGQIAVNPTQPGTAQLGPITVNARTILTDDNQRNNMLRRWILGTDQHEVITFTPTALVGAPASTPLGQPASFQIAGQLTIKDVTRDAIFDATVTPVSASELKGMAVGTIRYGDWNISIPDVPFVAGVGDQVRLELDFVATTA
jgi:polyisoprenoid-binding protein YceI